MVALMTSEMIWFNQYGRILLPCIAHVIAIDHGSNSSNVHLMASYREALEYELPKKALPQQQQQQEQQYKQQQEMLH